MRPARRNTIGSPLIRLAFAASLVTLVSAAPGFSYTWLGPFPPIVVVPPVGTPPQDQQTIPPLFDWNQPPGTGGTIDLSPPGPDVVTQGTPEPSTIVAGLIGAGALGLMRVWRKRRGNR